MDGSKYLDLIEEERGIERGRKGSFSIENLKDMLKVRAAFYRKVEIAFKDSCLTKEQRDHLFSLNKMNCGPK